MVYYIVCIHSYWMLENLAFDILSCILAELLGYQSINNKLMKLFFFYKYIYGILYWVDT